MASISGLFGDIPYTEGLNSTEFPLPKYDDAATIYSDLISRIKVASADLASGQGFTGADIVYGGDMNKWVKFANSLQLRLGMRLSDVNPTLSKDTAEDAIAGGVLESNADNATVVYQSNPPYTNPQWDDLVQSGRSDYLVANTIVDKMNSLNDPRRAAYFDDNLDGDFVGGEYGASNGFTSFTHIGTPFLDPTLEGIL